VKRWRPFALTATRSTPKAWAFQSTSPAYPYINCKVYEQSAYASLAWPIRSCQPLKKDPKLSTHSSPMCEDTYSSKFRPSRTSWAQFHHRCRLTKKSKHSNYLGSVCLAASDSDKNIDCLPKLASYVFGEAASRATLTSRGVKGITITFTVQDSLTVPTNA
jgi:hypothetical protein